MPAVSSSPRSPAARRRWRHAGCALLGAVAFLRLRSCFVASSGAERRGLPLADGLQWAAKKLRGPPPMRLGPGGGADPVNNVSPEMSAAGQMYAQKYEDIFMAGQKLWSAIKKKSGDSGPKKLYFIGTNGNSGDEIAESVLDSLAYIQAPDGTFFIHRKPGVDYPKIKYTMWVSDKKLGDKSKIAPPDLYMDDPEKYRDLESEIIKEFSELEYNGHPMGIVVGEGSMLRQENVDIFKQGILIWLDVDPEFSWAKTQHRPKQGGGLYVPPEYQQRPPVWAIANGWDGDIDDAEGKMEYSKIVGEHRVMYEKIANIRVRTDVPGVAENSYWGAGRIVKAMTEYLGFSLDEDIGVEEEVMERDLEKFLEGARLSKYMKPALKWCDEMGAASIEDVVENIPEISEALSLKPLERKRLEKAAAAVATA